MDVVKNNIFEYRWTCHFRHTITETNRNFPRIRDSCGHKKCQVLFGSFVLCDHNIKIDFWATTENFQQKCSISINYCQVTESQKFLVVSIYSFPLIIFIFSLTNVLSPFFPSIKKNYKHISGCNKTNRS